jgi:hypothetical protein
MVLSLRRRPLCQAVSKACATSKNTPVHISFFPKRKRCYQQGDGSGE